MYSLNLMLVHFPWRNEQQCFCPVYKILQNCFYIQYKNSVKYYYHVDKLMYGSILKRVNELYSTTKSFLSCFQVRSDGDLTVFFMMLFCGVWRMAELPWLEHGWVPWVVIWPRWSEQSGQDTMMLLLISLSLSVLTVRASLHEAIDTYIIQTDYGNIRGYSKMVLDKKLYVFSGIPYAKPPIGRRRFRKPEPLAAWDGILDGTKLPNTCVQEKVLYFPGFSGEEMWNPNTPLSRLLN